MATVDEKYPGIKALRDDVTRSLRRLAKLETAVRTFVAADSWCASDTDSAKRCPCGYAQVRAALVAIDQAKR